MCIDIENDYVFLSILHAKLENSALVLTWLVTSKHFRVERIIFVLFPEGFSSHLCFFAVSFLLIVSALRGKRKAGRNLCWLASTLSLFRPSSVRLPRNHAPAHFACNRVPISTGWSSNRHEGAPKKLQRKLPQKHRTHFVFRCPPISILAIGEKEREKGGIPEAIISYRWQSAVMEKERSRVQSPDRATIRGIYQIGGRYWRGSSSASWAS